MEFPSSGSEDDHSLESEKEDVEHDILESLF